MSVIKGVLKEELGNSRDMLKSYQREISKIKGCLIRKKIGKRYYYYLVKRQGKKVKFIYKGPISEQVRKAYSGQRKMLNKYKKLKLQVKNQIKFIRRALRGKETA